VLAVHALAPDQLELAKVFGEETGDEVDKMLLCRWRPGPEGVPLLEDCPRHMVGRVVSRAAFGDHTGFVLEPIEVDASSQGPVLMFSDVSDLAPGHGA
jgi:flavin reductase (DIM6/NTAB) family NADH-FMN oxidoreductase RutF